MSNVQHFDTRGDEKMSSIDAELRKQCQKANEDTAKTLNEVEKKIPPNGHGVIPMPEPEDER